MSRPYYYLISSLPMLLQGQEPPLTPADFLEVCRGHLAPDTLAVLSRISLVPLATGATAAERGWYARETFIRNCVATHRAAVGGIDSGPWLRAEADAWPSLRRRVEEALNAPDPLARERALDLVRWGALDDLAVGHYFDFDALVVYYLRLQLSTRRVGLTAAAGVERLLALVAALESQADEHRAVEEA